MGAKRAAALLTTVFLLVLAPAAQGANGGLPDPTFGSGGFTILDEPADPNEQLNDLVIQADGKILGAGTKSGESKGFLLARFNPDGSPDLGFGTGGIRIEPDFEATGAPRGIDEIEARPDGKVVALGLGRGETANAFVFARYTPEGVIDTTWGKGGFRLVQFLGFANPHALALAPDGKIVGVGDREKSAPVVRLTEDGKNDASFNAAPIGVREIDVPGTESEDGEAVKVLADGTVLVGGSAGSLGAFLAELDVNGNPVAGFGSGGGTITHDLGLDPIPSGSIEDLAVLGDGRIVAAGIAHVSGPNNELVVARFMPDGKLDPTFAAGGIFRTDPTPGGDTAEALEVQPDGKIVVAGQRGLMMADTIGDTYLLRLTANGQLDPSFGTGGETFASVSPAADRANGLALQGDGRPVIAGYADGAGHELLVGRFTADSPAPVGIANAKAKRCGGRKATLTGTSKADRIAGTKRADVIVTLGGNDRVNAKGGNDVICAGKGKDVVKGGKGRDRILGQAGKDRIIGGPGEDLCNGGPGKDVAAGCERP